MRIAICDGNQNDYQRLYQFLLEYGQRHPALAMEIKRFSTPLEIQGEYQLILLDVLLPQGSGIELIRSLRADGCQSAVVFVTASANYALEAFSVGAMQYLLKPLESQSLFAVLDSVVQALPALRVPKFLVSTPEGIAVLHYHNIVFVECARHLAYFHLSDQTTVCSKTLRQSFASYIAPLLAHKDFLLPHHSYCINRAYVSKLTPRVLSLHGGHSVPIAKDRLGEIKSKYLDYAMDIASC